LRKGREEKNPPTELVSFLIRQPSNAASRYLYPSLYMISVVSCLPVLYLSGCGCINYSTLCGV
jgi:hypothetical protein